MLCQTTWANAIEKWSEKILSWEIYSILAQKCLPLLIVWDTVSILSYFRYSAFGDVTCSGVWAVLQLTSELLSRHTQVMTLSFRMWASTVPNNLCEKLLAKRKSIYFHMWSIELFSWIILFFKWNISSYCKSCMVTVFEVLFEPPAW